MKILVACEFSGIVRDSFLAKGHDAWSCDILPTEAPGPHLQCDVLSILDQGWDMMIAHPPCTFLSYAGTAHWDRPGRKEKREDAMEFFKKLYNAPIEKICIENPLGEPIKWKPASQKINPFDFGEPVRKRILLWLKNLPPLFLGNLCEVKPVYVDSAGKNRYFTDAMRGSGGGKEGRRKARAKFFPAVAKAMANQWS